ncbi:MAG: sigma 54-interacting transcriptional regulator [Candidatus Eisenbacteria bacterium]|nr:sigma 54-interacting transcriptional regulator [Candidatus Eisenbacteria bacterium]
MVDRNDIAHLEERLAVGSAPGAEPSLADLELLADLYIQADHYLPALETIDCLLSLPAARTLSRTRRAALESRAVACRLARGDSPAALAQCRELLADEASYDSPALCSRLHLLCARACLDLGRIEDARASAERGLKLADSIADLALSANALTWLGVAAYRAGELAIARDHTEQAIALYRRLGDELSAARARNNLGLIHKNLCEWDGAIAHFRSALEVYERSGHFADTANPLMNLGIVQQKMGDWQRAADTYRECEQVLLRIGEDLRLARVAIGLGNVARLQRRFPDAESHLLAALERARRLSARREEVLALEFLGELDYDRDRPERALARYQEALALAARTAPEGDLVVELERRRAEALRVLGRLDEADEACGRSRRLARLTDDRFEYAATHRVAGEIALARGRVADACSHLESAKSLLQDCRERFELARTCLLLGRHSADSRSRRVHLFRACALFAEVGSAYWLAQAEDELQRLIEPASHGPSAAAAARVDTVLGRRHRAPGLVACSHAMRQVEALARRAAVTDLSVLITGETGTGKELVARTIHSLSQRAGRPFLAVNCGALRADLALSQLFGHRKGAFTGAHAEGVGLVEAANGGTLFLDEVGELPHDVQVTLLRFLESGEYLRLGETQARRAEVRIIAATNRELRGNDGEKHFRRDLLFRLNEIEIRLPALRERAEDVLPLARHFLSFYGGIGAPHLAPDAEGVLASFGWPGNVRELENVMKRIAALCATDARVTASDVLPFLADDAQVIARSERTVERASAEREAILAAWKQAHGNKSRLAGLLGVSRKTLYARIKRLRIEL